jgi:hypothetical protein
VDVQKTGGVSLEMLALNYVVSAYKQLLVGSMALQSDVLNRLPFQL